MRQCKLHCVYIFLFLEVINDMIYGFNFILFVFFFFLLIVLYELWWKIGIEQAMKGEKCV